jgi:hypothetical protein
MTKILQFLLYEPLVYFFLLGGVVYLYYSSIQTQPTKQSQTQQLQCYKGESRNDFHYRVYTTLLLQEAKKLELEKSDPIVVARLLEQVAFILKSTQTFVEPNEEILFAYYKKHQSNYSDFTQVSFLYLEFAKHDDVRLQKLEKLREVGMLEDPKGCKMADLWSKEEVQGYFGSYFLNGFAQQPIAQWSKPLQAKNSFVMVKILKKIAKEPLDFDMVEGEVYEDYKREFLENMMRDSYKKLLKNFTIVEE